MKEVLENIPHWMVYSAPMQILSRDVSESEKSDEHDAPALVGVDATTKQQEAIQKNLRRDGCVSQQPYAMDTRLIWAVETTAPKKSVVIEKMYRAIRHGSRCRLSG